MGFHHPLQNHISIEKNLAMTTIGCHAKQKDRHLQRYIQNGEEMVKQCIAAIEEIQKSFKFWSERTKALHYALQDTLGMSIYTKAPYSLAERNDH